jgi:hypothetical protein
VCVCECVCVKQTKRGWKKTKGTSPSLVVVGESTQSFPKTYHREETHLEILQRKVWGTCGVRVFCGSLQELEAFAIILWVDWQGEGEGRCKSKWSLSCVCVCVCVCEICRGLPMIPEKDTAEWFI